MSINGGQWQPPESNEPNPAPSSEERANDSGSLKVVEVVHVYPTRVWVEDDFFGSRHVMMQHETCEPFCYASFHYDYRYTSNAGTWAASEALAKSLGATEPIERRFRAALGAAHD